MYHPTLNEVQSLAVAQQERQNGKAETRRPLLPLYCDLLADIETPVSAYCKAARGPYSFLLESVAGGERIARYSFIGLDPYLVLTHRDETATLRYMPASGVEGRTEHIHCHDPLEIIQAELGKSYLVPFNGKQRDELPRFHGGAVGYLAYEAAARFERLPVPEKNTLNLPLSVFCFTETVLVFDHLKHRVRVVTHLRLDEPDLEAEYERCAAILADVRMRLQQDLRFPEEPVRQANREVKISSNRTQAEFEGIVERAKEYILAGDIFQVVPSQRLSRPVQAAPFTVYRALRAINPSPYMFFLDLEEFHIVGASPELLVRVEDNEVTIHPIAGTRPRGSDMQEDDQLAEELSNDLKERAEHVMLVDLGRNDVGRVSQAGSVQVTEFMQVERYSHVMHLVSNITGQLRPDVSPFAALRAGFPAGTVSGAPKIRAMQIISELEGEQRGVYAGAVGYFSHSGNLDTAIALRTMVIKDGTAYVQAGCGIVADSNPTAEYQESMNKAGALLRALELAEQIAETQIERGQSYAFTH